MTVRIVRQDFQAVNGCGVTLRTFNDPAKGRAWVRENAALHEGLVLEEVALTARRIYRPPSISRRRFDLAIPAYREARA